MDLDGPANDKGLYALVPVKPEMSIRNQDVISWKTFARQTGRANARRFHVAGLARRPVRGDHVRGRARTRSSYYVANFKDYRFLQVFYPTRGILAWYNRATGRCSPAGSRRSALRADQWRLEPGRQVPGLCPGGSQGPLPRRRELAEYANDPNETQIQYDLYRIPFNGGQGGKPEPIAGASHNGMSNTFPKVSPDGRWIVFVKCRNGQLMRPDSQLYIVPAQAARRGVCAATRRS